MKMIGIRELKSGLSRYLREVRAGERLWVTDRGNVIAEIRPPDWKEPELDPAEQRYRRAVAEGRIIPARVRNDDRWLEWPGLGLPPGTAQELIDWVRREDHDDEE